MKALVTGGGRGIGAKIARGLAAGDWEPAVTGRTRDEVESVAAEIGGVAMLGDVSNRADVEGWAAAAGMSNCSSATPGWMAHTRRCGGRLALDPASA